MKTDDLVMSTVLQTRAIELLLEEFKEEPPQFGRFPVHPAIHSICVGGDLTRYGFPLNICLAGYCHNLETVWYDLSEIAQNFGDQVANYVLICSPGPKFEAENLDKSEDGIFERVKAFTEDEKDVGPLAIKCVAAMDLVRGARYYELDQARKRFERAQGWLHFGRPYLSREHNDLVLDFVEVLRREGLRINYPVPTDAKPQH